MPTIAPNTGIVTQINVSTVPQGGQPPLIELLDEAARACREVPGWISASLHRSLDGTRVVNDAQAIDAAAMTRVFEHLHAEGFIARNQAFGRAAPGLYEVVRTLER